LQPLRIFVDDQRQACLECLPSFDKLPSGLSSTPRSLRLEESLRVEDRTVSGSTSLTTLNLLKGKVEPLGRPLVRLMNIE
jgi:hypothetical protein